MRSIPACAAVRTPNRLTRRCTRWSSPPSRPMSARQDHTIAMRRRYVSSQRFSIIALLAGVAATAVLCTSDPVMAQGLKDVQTSDKPLVLKAHGSFFVGGDKVEQTQGELGGLGPAGHIAVN